MLQLIDYKYTGTDLSSKQFSAKFSFNLPSTFRSDNQKVKC